MAAYTPPTISPSDPFDPDTVKGGFKDFGDAINATVNTSNLTTGLLSFRPFHKHALSETWKAGNNGLTASMPVRYATTVDADTLTVQSNRDFALLNKFDVEDLCLRIYVQHEATLIISASVDLLYAKTQPHGSVTFTHEGRGNIFLDGTAQVTKTVVTVEAGADAARLPMPVQMNAIATSVSAGWHDIWVRVDFRDSTTSTNTVDGFIHWRCSGRSLNVVALYR